MLIVDGSKCSGCRLCRQICAIEHFGEINPRKAALRIGTKFPKPGGFEPRVCNQCGECAAVCPTQAIGKRADGVYCVNPSECTLCEACVEACPERVMFAHPEVAYPIKCDFCRKCVEVCNTGALVWLEAGDGPRGRAGAGGESGH